MPISDAQVRARERMQFLFARPVAFHRCFVDVTGSVNAALMLSQALYWLAPARQGEDRGKDGGWFWKTRKEWEAELGLSRCEQEGARKQLRATKFWLEKERRLQHRIYFSVDFVELEKALEAAAHPPKNARAPHRPTGGSSTSNEARNQLLAEGGKPTPDGGGKPTPGKALTHPPTAAENPLPRWRQSLPRKEQRLSQRLSETTTTSQLAIGLQELMPQVPWDEDAVHTLEDDCLTREPTCTPALILEQVVAKVKAKGLSQIQNPIGFVLRSVPKAVQAAARAARLAEEIRVEREAALAQQLLQVRERDAKFEEAQQAFDALRDEEKQERLARERHLFASKHPQERDRIRRGMYDSNCRRAAVRTFMAEQVNCETRGGPPPPSDSS